MPFWLMIHVQHQLNLITTFLAFCSSIQITSEHLNPLQVTTMLGYLLHLTLTLSFF